MAEAAPPLATAQPAPEGTGGAGTESLEANLTLPEAVAWFESVHSGRRFRRRQSSAPDTLERKRPAKADLFYSGGAL